MPVYQVSVAHYFAVTIEGKTDRKDKELTGLLNSCEDNSTDVNRNQHNAKFIISRCRKRFIFSFN